MRVYYYFVVLIGLCLSQFISAQTISLRCEKPGSLKALLKNHQGVTDIKVSGTLNAKDMTELYALSSLTSLDLSDASYDLSNKKSNIQVVEGKEKKEYHLYDDIFYLYHKNLNKLAVPNACRRIENVSGQSYNLTDLYIPYQVFEHLSLDNEKILSTNIHVKGVQNIYGETKTNAGKRAKRLENDRFSKLLKRVYAIYLDKMPYDFDVLGLFVPSIVIINNGPTFLYEWRGNSAKISRQDLSSIDIICSGAFSGHKELEEVEIPQNIKYMSRGCFSGCSLKKLVLSNVEKIEALCGNGYRDNGEIKELYFENSTPPMADDSFFEMANKSKMQIYIPSGARKQFAIGNWKNTVLHEIGEESVFNIKIEDIGTLSKYITDDVASSATSMSITGILYDTEIPVLEKCRGLVMLDLSKAMIVKSPETLKKEQDESEALVAAFGAMINLAAAQSQIDVKNGTGNIADAIGTKAIADGFNKLMETATPEEIKPSNECILPFLHFDMLEELRLPMVLKNINNYICSSVKRIVFPPTLESVPMAAFGHCSNLESLVFPKSVKEVTGELKSDLHDCRNLKVLDFGNTQITSLPAKFFYDVPTLHVEKLVLPSTVQSLDYFSMELSCDCDLYIPVKEIKSRPFISQESNSQISEIRIHIPKGYKAVWGSLNDLTHKVKLIDDL